MSLDLNIRAFVRCPIADPPALEDENALGIELEYEQVQTEQEHETDCWVAARDGSLRDNGVELVSIPLAFEEVEDALAEVETIVRGTQAVATMRCGLHTHMNMRPYSIGQVWSLAALYAIIEPTLFETYAQHRIDSMFAVPMWLNTNQVNSLFRDINYIRQMREGEALPACQALHTSKYSALNFASLATFGTLEMRQPYCSTDFEAIRSWTDFCCRLVETGTSYEDPCEVLDMYERTSLEEVQELMFGDTYSIDPDIQELAEDAAYYICGEVQPPWQELEWEIPTLEAT